MRTQHTTARLALPLLACLTLTGCDKFLDVIPEETQNETSITKDRNAARNFMYSCYGFLPQANSKPGSLDLLTGDECVTSFEHETFANFPKGTYSASAPVISYWNTLYQGIRQCHTFLDELNRGGNFEGLLDSDRDDYKAQVHFLLGYYNFLLMRCYGPIILVRETPDATTAVDDYLGRTPYDECVDYAVAQFDEAARGLPATRSGERLEEFGFATSTAALSLKAKLLLQAASPLFNGGWSLAGELRGPDGTPLLPTTPDPAKWERARDAYRAAIEACEAAGYALYERDDAKVNQNGFPAAGPTRRARYVITDYTNDASTVGLNNEVVWADARNEGGYGIQSCSLPYISGGEFAYNGICPTLAMLDRFYTKNGIPIAEDKTWDYDARWDLVTVDADHAEQAKEGRQTMKYNLDREPRYYAWVAFQGGFFEVMSAANNGGYANDASYNAESDSRNGRLVCDFVIGGNTSRGANLNNLRTNNYSPGGFLNKKGLDPDISKNRSGDAHHYYPWPLVRMADLYLGMAECLVETGDLARAKTYVDRVRTRAGLEGVDASWAAHSRNPGKPNSQEGMRDIVRQERMVEMYLENQNFWDMRRWLLAERYFSVQPQGMNITATTLAEFAEVTTVSVERSFRPANYLLPIPTADMNRNPKVMQNPGY